MSDKEHNGSVGPGAYPSRPSRRLKPSLSSRRAHVEAEIGKKMRAMYAELVEQPLPDRFVELLKQIDQAQENKPR
jgi:hypothetical protein